MSLIRPALILSSLPPLQPSVSESGLSTVKPMAPRGSHATPLFLFLLSSLFTATARMESVIRQQGAGGEKLPPAAAAGNVNKAQMKLSERKML